MNELPEADLLREIEAFCARTGITPSALGVAALNDKALVSNLRNGREMRRMTRQRVRDFMAEYRIPSSEESERAGSAN